MREISPDEVRELLKRHGLTGSVTAKLCGVSPRAVRSWQAPAGTSSFRPIPYAAWRLLRIATGEEDPREIIKEREELQRKGRYDVGPGCDRDDPENT